MRVTHNLNIVHKRKYKANYNSMVFNLHYCRQIILKNVYWKSGPIVTFYFAANHGKMTGF